MPTRPAPCAAHSDVETVKDVEPMPNPTITAPRSTTSSSVVARGSIIFRLTGFVLRHRGVIAVAT
jgi:hypothetical protein